MVVERRVLALALLLAAWGSPGFAQQPTANGGTLRVFLDCQQTRCDFDYLRTEVGWVNWVRDQQVAQLHLLVTSQRTGSGGREYTLQLQGRQEYAGRVDTLRATTPETATDAEERTVLARAMKLALVGYAARLPIASRLDVSYTAAGQVGQVAPADDPWNYWVFRVGLSGDVSGESRSERTSLSGSLSATRTTELWRFRVAANGNRRSNEFLLSDSTTFTDVTVGAGAEALAVRSLGDHWSLGVLAGVDRSEPANMDRQMGVVPGIEYNVFPYAESTRRQLTFLYELGLIHSMYADTTIYDKLSEILLQQQLTVSLESRETWGSTNLTVRGASYLHDLGKNQVSVSGRLRIRLIQGLQLNVSGSYTRIRDQLYLAKEGASDEEILLRLRDLETSFRYGVSVGFSYTFGSIYNNIVNPRFSNRDEGR